MKNKKIDQFVAEAKERFKSLNVNSNWEDSYWNTSDWLPHRGQSQVIEFKTIRTKIPWSIKGGQSISIDYQDFMKALIIHIQHQRGSGFISTKNYCIELRRIYCLVMHPRKERSAAVLTTWHFQQALEFRKEEKYKNLYDTAANLKLVADSIDSLSLLDRKLDFQHSFKPDSSRHAPKKLSKLEDDNTREEEKLPSAELFEAYAQITNNPINDHEKILLRTIDLLIATGQRANEVSLIPYDCWVEREKLDSEGNLIRDAHGNVIKTYGIRYYAEKQFQPRIHYLSDQDLPFTRRAINDLKELTKEVRQIAAWQENNPGKIWDFKDLEIIDDDSLLKFLCFKSPYGLHKYLEKHKLGVVTEDQNQDRGINQGNRRYLKRRWYNVAELNEKLCHLIPDHRALKVMQDNEIKTILKTSEVLSIKFRGAFRFKERSTNLIKISPERTFIRELNGALGAISNIQSIFERREMTNEDDTKLKTTTHSFRHWRNTIYQLTGMTDVQQALALGRQNLSQNKAYQHTTLKEKTSHHKGYLAFDNNTEKVDYLRHGIRKGKIAGPIKDLYEKIKQEQSSKDADEFLDTHANALHVTPYGGCTHDFSQSPCAKHIQCWNGCSHLHRTQNPDEQKTLEALLEKLIKSRATLSADYSKNSVWLSDLDKKISNLKSAVKLNLSEGTQVFPDGTSLFPKQNKSSVE